MAQDNEGKRGFTVQEIESMAKKYRFEVFFCLAFVLAALFSYIFSMMGWSVFLCALGGIIGMLIPNHTEKWLGHLLSFCCKQEKVTQIIIGVILLALSVIISPLIFVLLGLMGGKSIHKDTLHHKGQHLHENLDDSQK